jgi:hypothetical protein
MGWGRGDQEPIFGGESACRHGTEYNACERTKNLKAATAASLCVITVKTLPLCAEYAVQLSGIGLALLAGLFDLQELDRPLPRQCTRLFEVLRSTVHVYTRYLPS